MNSFPSMHNCFIDSYAWINMKAFGFDKKFLLEQVAKLSLESSLRPIVSLSMNPLQDLQDHLLIFLKCLRRKALKVFRPSKLLAKINNLNARIDKLNF